MKYWRYEMEIPDMDGFPGGWDWRKTGVLLVGFVLPMEMGKWRIRPWDEIGWNGKGYDQEEERRWLRS